MWFRKKRSTVDQLLALTDLVVTRTKLNQSTFTAFVDFKKAYDFINRDKLWKRLFESGISGKMLNAIMSLYKSVSSCVRVNTFKTEWFNVHSGLRQGCILSPLLFNLYINDLAKYIKRLNIGDEKICILLYADDIVLLAETANDLQVLLDALHDWCCTHDMNIDSMKSNIVQFRPLSVPVTDVIFMCGDANVSVVIMYLQNVLLRVLVVRWSFNC